MNIIYLAKIYGIALPRHVLVNVYLKHPTIQLAKILFILALNKNLQLKFMNVKESTSKEKQIVEL